MRASPHQSRWVSSDSDDREMSIITLIARKSTLLALSKHAIAHGERDLNTKNTELEPRLIEQPCKCCCTPNAFHVLPKVSAVIVALLVLVERLLAR
jgi:hypothetical protein